MVYDGLEIKGQMAKKWKQNCSCSRSSLILRHFYLQIWLWTDCLFTKQNLHQSLLLVHKNRKILSPVCFKTIKTWSGVKVPPWSVCCVHGHIGLIYLWNPFQTSCIDVSFWNRKYGSNITNNFNIWNVPVTLKKSSTENLDQLNIECL